MSTIKLCKMQPSLHGCKAEIGGKMFRSADKKGHCKNNPSHKPNYKQHKHQNNLCNSASLFFHLSNIGASNALKQIINNFYSKDYFIWMYDLILVWQRIPHARKLIW